MGILDKLSSGLSKTRAGFTDRLVSMLRGGIGEETLDELEEVLYTSDIGVKTTTEIVERLRAEGGKIKDDVEGFIKRLLLETLGPAEPLVIAGDIKPYVILIAGVNGVGKTTTIGKLGSRYTGEGKKVIFAASDTFRAAAVQQIEIWAERAGAQLVKHKSGSDPAAVAFDAVEAAKARGADVVIVDTAGRLHTKTPLMEELKKIHRVIGKSLPGAPHETLLVVDSTTGQNALRQAELFNEAIDVTGIALTKLDGSSKGGMVFAIRKELGIPVKLIGIGEAVDDLRDFDPALFVEALFAHD